MNPRALVAAEQRREARSRPFMARHSELCADGVVTAQQGRHWLNRLVGVGLSAPVTHEHLAAAEAFWARHGCVGSVATCAASDPSLERVLRERGYRIAVEIDQYLRSVADPLPSEGDPLRFERVRAGDPVAVRHYLEQHHWGFSGTRDPVPAEVIEVGERIVAYPPHQVFLAWRGDRCVGTASLEIDDDRAILFGATVDEGVRRTGVHAHLFKYRMRVAAGLGARWALVASTPGGPTARNAERLGFRCVARTQIWTPAD